MTGTESRLRAANVRDEADLFTLTQLREALSRAALAAFQADEIRNPEARWQVADLIEALGAQIADIDAERERIRNSAPVLEEVA